MPNPARAEPGQRRRLTVVTDTVRENSTLEQRVADLEATVSALRRKTDYLQARNDKLEHIVVAFGAIAQSAMLSEFDEFEDEELPGTSS